MFGAPSAKSRAMREREPTVIVITEEEAAPMRARYRPASPWPARALGAVVTAVVHMLLSAPFVLGYGAHQVRQRPADGPGSVAWASQGEQAESMMLLDLSSISKSPVEETPTPAIDAVGITPDELELQLVSVDPTPPPDLKFDEEAEEAETNNQAAGDPAGNAVLFGRYMGHVAARIERAWMRPRSAVEAGQFDCRARISQDRTGNVLSVDLFECSADEVWKKSLTSAILRASPISAPPEPWLFTNTLTLSFSAQQYEDGKTAEYLYEPVIRRVAMQETAFSQPAPVGPGSEPGEYELTSDGNKLVWKKKNSATTKQ
jgi:hypothetical protein